MSAAEPQRAVPKTRFRPLRWITWTLVLVALYALAGFYGLPWLARPLAERQLSATLDRTVTIAAIRFNPFTLEAWVEGLSIAGRQSATPLFAFEALYVDAALESIVRRGPVLKAVRLSKPAASFAREENGSYSFDDLVAKFSGGEPAQGEPVRFSLANVEVLQGRIVFDDRLERVTHDISEVEIGLPFLSSLPVHADVRVLPRFSARVNGDPVSLAAESLPFKDPRDTALKLELRDVDLPRYLDYVPFDLDFKMPSARLATDLVARFAAPPGAPLSLTVQGTVKLDALSITEKTGAALITVPGITAELRQFDLAQNRLEIGTVAIDAPQITVRRSPAGALNLEALMPRPRARNGESAVKPANASARDKPFALTVAEIGLTSGRIDYTDDAHAGVFKTRIENIDIKVREVGLRPEDEARYEASFTTDRGVTAKAQGSLHVAPLSSKGSIELAGIRLTDYAPYYEAALRARIAAGSIDAGGKYQYIPTESSSGLSLQSVSASLRDFRLQTPDGKRDAVQIAKLGLTGFALDLDAREIAIESLTLAGARVAAQRNPDGSIDLAQFVAADPGTPSQDAAAPAKPWSYALKQVSLEGSAIRFQDGAIRPAAGLALEALQVKLDNLSSAAGTRSAVAVRASLNKRGTLAAEGWITLDPFATNLKIDTSGIELVPFQAYFTEQINVAVGTGRLNVAGRLELDAAAGAPLKASFRGNASIEDFASTDKLTAEELLKWKLLKADAVSFALEPLAVSVDEISLADFYSRLIITSEGRLNLQNLLAGEARASAAPATPPAKPEPGGAAAGAGLRIGRVVLKDGQVAFSDFFIKPNYSANLTKVSGSVSEMSPQTPGTVEVRALINDTGALEVAGRINPLAPALFLDIKGRARDIELPPVSPYTIKYIGHAIERGKLSLDVTYRIEDARLTAVNDITLDQLTFGERIDGTEAANVPIQLAVALLKDRNGVIDLNVPVAGSLDDPEFSLAGLVLRALLNLVTKAVTAPFALLSSAFGGGAELSYVEFAPGDAAFSEGARERLETLAKALGDRPALKLDISGRTDPEADRQGLRRAKLEAEVKAQRHKALAAQGNPQASPDAVKVEPHEYAEYLRLAYRAAPFDKPRNAIGLLRDLPVAEMEKLMLDNITVSEDDLRALADERARAARDFLVRQAGIAADRIFLTAPRSGAEGIDDKGKVTRADFSLR